MTEKSSEEKAASRPETSPEEPAARGSLGRPQIP